MSNRTEILLHWAAIANIAVLGAAFISSQCCQQPPAIGPPWNYLLGAVFGVVLATFNFYMLIECAFGGRWTRVRVSWLVFMLLLPIAGEVAYFLSTRSRTFASSIAPKRLS